MSGGKEDYYEFHESSFELAEAEDFEKNVPDECKGCEQLSYFHCCKLKYDPDEEYECPLLSLLCKQCQFYCSVHNQEGEEMDYGFCSEREIQLLNDECACQHFREWEGGLNVTVQNDKED